jgi:hypothetical protein
MKIRRKIVRNEEYEQRTQLTGGDVLILAGIIQAQFCELPLFHYSEGANKCITAENTSARARDRFEKGKRLSL